MPVNPKLEVQREFAFQYHVLTVVWRVHNIRHHNALRIAGQIADCKYLFSMHF